MSYYECQVEIFKMNKSKIQYAIINEIVRETEKAILVSADGETWLPKSQIKIHKIENFPTVIAMPSWLWLEKRSFLRMRTSPQKIFEMTGKTLE